MACVTPRLQKVTQDIVLVNQFAFAGAVKEAHGDGKVEGHARAVSQGRSVKETARPVSRTFAQHRHA